MDMNVDHLTLMDVKIEKYAIGVNELKRNVSLIRA